MDLFVRSWKGQASLAKAFWLVYFLFGLILFFAITLLLALIVPGFSYIEQTNLIVTILFPYTVFSAICVWRCANNSTLFWKILARIIVVLAVISGIVHIWQLIAPPTVHHEVPASQA